jgi:hypothetical protein
MKKNVYYTNDSAGPFMSGQQVNSTISRIGPLEKGQFMEMQKADNLKNVETEVDHETTLGGAA